ncbi:MAG TPA: prolyl aminopeptidase [Noviherbaspirillum sp.]|uniref:prolyl aminopeptidase n=1 Tax=Noviherbaspirillum sp. TaxID=1926288 RepID=UPI002D3709FE|nr:prolyl aminopeptidase [Noviherbaspirillum sp.]HYD95321.1 prolyl aminopeptidase [Noviherbaspirillum sp.]
MDASPDLSLFPPIEARRTGMLPVDSLHTIYWEESGNPDGIPVVYVHGGPGGGSSPEKRQWFDPDAYRIILFDQRGAYRSTPLAEVEGNTTRLLVDDMEKLRKMLGIEQWLVAGGSWGTTLSLAYGQTYPDSCLGFTLRGIFLGTPSEIDWFLHGMRLFFPKAHDDFVQWLPAEERSDILTAFEKRLFGTDAERRMEAARMWFKYTEACSLLRHDPQLVEEAAKNDTVVYGVGRLDAFYFRNNMFLEQDQLIARIDRIAHLPLMIVQGGHDVIAPPAAAYQVHRAWPGSVLHIAADAGHSPSEPGIRKKVIQALEQFKRERRFDAGALQASGPV